MAGTRSIGTRSRRIDQHVGERIRLRRTELGLTQEQLADTLDVSYQQIQKYETGANRISAGRIYEIARKLRVEIGYFFEGLEPDDGGAATPLEHGGRQRTAIELVRKFAQIKDPEVRAAIAGLVKTIVERDD
jgi:transcriptional regulator with XRE-family HTH domain